MKMVQVLEPQTTGGKLGFEMVINNRMKNDNSTTTRIW